MIASRKINKKAKTPAQDRKAVALLDKIEEADRAARKAKAATIPVAPVTSIFPAKKELVFAGFGQPVYQDDSTIFASDCH